VTYRNPFAGAADQYAEGRPYHHARTLRRALAGRRPGVALDVARGTGLSTRGLAELGIAAVGVDVVPAMVARARADTGPTLPDPAFLDWLRGTYLRRFPSPPRGPLAAGSRRLGCSCRSGPTGGRTTWR
jgi:SAM-dependent methyltransferase